MRENYDTFQKISDKYVIKQLSKQITKCVLSTNFLKVED